MKYIWIIFLVISIQEIICDKILDNKKQMVVYGVITILSIVLCMSYYSNEYGNSLLGMVNDKINLERLIWIK